MKLKIVLKDGTEYQGNLVANRYSTTNRICLSIESMIEGPIAKFTVNMTTLPYVPEDNVLIKGYGENEGLYEQLIEQKVIDKANSIYHLNNNCKIYQCKLLIDIEKLPKSVFR